MNARAMKGMVLLFAAALVVAVAAPAWAHEEVNPRSLPTGTPTFFLLGAANEEKADLVKITLTAPAGLPLGATTKQPAGWTANVSPTAIVWTGGAVKPGTFEQWGFETDGADQPGSFSYKVTLTFSDGKTNDVTPPPVTVTASTGPPPPSTTIAGGPAVTTSPTSVVVGPAVSESSSKPSQSTARLALVIATVALILALLATGLGVASRKSVATRASESPVTGDAQDW